MAEHKYDEYDSDDGNSNLNQDPSPFAPSDLSITGIDVYQSSHINSIVLREKVLIVGDATVGKSSLVKSFLSQGVVKTNHNNYLMTSSVDMNVKHVPIYNTNITVDLFLFDIGGQNIFNQRELSSKFWKNCSYIMCVFDVSSRKSLQSCETWIKAVQSAQEGSGNDAMIPIILVANKVDFREGDESVIEVDEEDGRQFAQQYDAVYFECSCQRYITVDQPFMHIASQSATQYQKDRDVDDQSQSNDWSVNQ